MKKSKCCQVDVRVEGKTTKYYVCKLCREACDLKEKVLCENCNKPTDLR